MTPNVAQNTGHFLLGDYRSNGPQEKYSKLSPDREVKADFCLLAGLAT